LRDVQSLQHGCLRACLRPSFYVVPTLLAVGLT
jgi:hypothetical protein